MVGISGTSRSGKQYHYYSCNKQRLKHGCDRKPIPRDLLEQTVLNAVYEAMDDDMIHWMVEATINYGEKIQEERGIPQKKELLAAEKRKIRHINDAIAEGVWNSSTSSILYEHEKTAAILEKEIANLEKEFTPPDREHVEFYFDMLRKKRFSTPQNRRNVIEQFVKAVYAYDDHVDIILYYPDNGGRRSRRFDTLPGADVHTNDPNSHQ